MLIQEFLFAFVRLKMNNIIERTIETRLERFHLKLELIDLFVELVLLLVLLDVVLVTLLKVFRQYDVAVLADGLHSSLRNDSNV